MSLRKASQGKALLTAGSAACRHGSATTAIARRRLQEDARCLGAVYLDSDRPKRVSGSLVVDCDRSARRR